jgi:hypothetical protein
MSSEANSPLIVYLLKQSQKHSNQIENLKRKQRHLKKTLKNNRKNMLCTYKWLDYLDSYFKEQTDIQNYRYEYIERIVNRIRECNKTIRGDLAPSCYENETDCEDEADEEDSSSDYNTEDEENDETDSSDEDDDDDDDDEDLEEEEEEEEEEYHRFRIPKKVVDDGDSSSDYDTEDEKEDEGKEVEKVEIELHQMNVKEYDGDSSSDYDSEDEIKYE